MASLNKMTLIGRLGRDPEVRYTQNGTAVCNFSVAIDETRKDAQGRTQQRVEWVRISAWEKLGEHCGTYLKKGRLVYVEGKLRSTKREVHGHEQTFTEVTAQVVTFLDSAKNGQTDGAPADGHEAPKAPSRPPAQQSVHEAMPPDLDDVPF